MSKLICSLHGVRGRAIDIYDNKCVIKTELTAGSIFTRNATDGEKTIFYIDCTGIQFKECKLSIGYLQLETPSTQMNNQDSNFFSENTFTFDLNNSITNELMREIYNYICIRVEGYKYGFDPDMSYEPSDAMMKIKDSIVSDAVTDINVIFYCPRCFKVFSGERNSSKHCSNCGIGLIETSISRDKWRELSSEEKNKYKRAWNPLNR